MTSTLKRDLLRAAVFGTALSLPIAGTIVIITLWLRPASVQQGPSPAAYSEPAKLTVADIKPEPVPAVTVTVTRKPRSSGAQKPKRRPQGDVELVEWHNEAANNKCVDVDTYIENRSDTAINEITVKFRTTYTPKHGEDEYPESKNGPVKILTQVAGISPYGKRKLIWEVCAPELAKRMNPYRPEMTDAFMSEIGAIPEEFSWTWVEE